MTLGAAPLGAIALGSTYASSDIAPTIVPRATLLARGDLQVGTQHLTGPGLYRLLVVNRQGVPYCELPESFVQSCSWHLNDDGAMSLTTPRGDDRVKTYLHAITVELQLWRGPVLLWWGVPVKYQRSGDVKSWEAGGLLWYFTRRYVGKPLTNLTANFHFNLAAPGTPPVGGWVAVDRAVDAGTGAVTLGSAAGLGTVVYAGAGSTEPVASLVSTDVVNTDGQEIYWSKRFTIAGRPFGSKIDADVEYEVTAWPSTFDADGKVVWNKTFQDRALWIGFFPVPSAALPTYVATDELPQGFSNYEPTYREEDLGRTWFRMHTSIQIPPDIAGTLEVRLYVAPGATVGYRNLYVTADESLDFRGQRPEDILIGLIRHGQGEDGVATGLSNLNIGTASVGHSFLYLDRRYFYAERPNIHDSLSEFSEMPGGVDYSIEISDSVRTFTTWYPFKGRRWEHLILEDGRNCVLDGDSFDGSVATNDLTIQSPVSRAIDARQTDSTLFDGVTLQTVFQSPLEAYDPLLLSLSCSREMSDPRELTFITYESAAGHLVGSLKVGDFVICKVYDQEQSINQVRRVTQLELVPASDTMRVTTKSAACFGVPWT